MTQQRTKFSLVEDFDDPRNSDKIPKNQQTEEKHEANIDDFFDKSLSNFNEIIISALFELICELSEPDVVKRNHLLTYIARILADIKLVPSLCFSECLQPARQPFLAAIKRLINKATSYVNSKTHIKNPGPAKTKSGSTNTSSVSLPLAHTLSHLSDLLCTSFNNSSHTLTTLVPSRYCSEYQELGCLGRGGFGQVYKVKSYIDDQQYAMKKITFDVTHADEGIKILREVKILAQLNHTNIVRYFGAWIEMAPSIFKDSPKNPSKSQLTSISSAQIKSITEESSSEYATSSNSKRALSSPSIIFENVENQQLISVTDNYVVKEPSKSTTSTSIDLNFEKNRKIANNKPKNSWNISNSLVLYMQMEIGSVTLRELLTSRNNKIPANSSPFSFVDAKQNEHILKQIVSALAYIHGNGVIHRDVKPSNIFIKQPEQRVMLGDFGLACLTECDSDKSDLLAIEEPSSSQSRNLVKCNKSAFMSTGIGTVTYSAPEQLNSRCYDYKVDVYSLGMIAFEMYYPFRTQMERMHCLMGLKTGKICSQFENAWPAETFVINKLVQHDPLVRPSAKDLMEMDFFLSNNDLIENLKRQLKKVLEDNVALKAEVKALKAVT